MANTTIPSELIQADVALGGSPTTTTQSAGNNTTKLATTAFVTTAVNNLIASAPGTMDTLNEIAAALNDDPDFTTTVNNAIATKLPLAGGTMTGTIAGFTSTGIDDNATSTAITIDSSENVGIGTTSPSKTLHVNGELQIENNLTLNENTPAMVIPNGDFRLFTGGSEAMRIDQSQNVGIGETSPANLLHVKASDTGIAPHTSAQIVLEREGTNYLQFLTAETGTSGLLFGDGSDVDVSKITVDHNTTKMTFTNETVDTMTLNGANVGIGTSSPTEKLTLNGALAITGALADDRTSTAAMDFSGGVTRFVSYGASGTGGIFAFRTASGGASSTERMRINSTGEVGIGTTPVAHYTGYRALDIGTAMSLFSNSGSTNVATMTNNGYLNSSASQWTYKVADEATMYSQVNGDHRFSTAASGSAGGAITWLEKFRITADGNVGISTTSPSAKLEVIHGNVSQGNGVSFGRTASQSWDFWGDSGANVLYSKGNFAIIGTSDSQDLSFRTNNTDRMRIDSNGRVGIGTAGGNSGLHVANGDIRVTAAAIANDANSLSISHESTGGTICARGPNTSTRGTIQLSVNASNGGNGIVGLRVNNDATVVMGTTSSNPVNIGDHRLVVELNSSTAGIAVGADGLVDSRQVMTFYNDNGTVGTIITNASSTAYNTSSDYRLKENVEPIQNGFERLNQLNPVKFDWKEDGTSSEGFIAHEVQAIFPDAVSGEKDDEIMQGMDYGRITPLLVKAIQEQQTIIDDLKTRIETLEG